MTTPDGTVLLTGATGFVGMELLARYLERTDRHVLALVRAGSDEAARERIDAVLANLFGDRAGRYRRPRHGGRRRLTAPGLGLDPRAPGLARGGVDDDRPLCGLGVVRRCRSTRPGRSTSRAPAGCSTSPSWAHGARRPASATPRSRPRTSPAPTRAASAECDLDVGQGFHNTYEQSKFEAEQLVRAHAEPAVHDLPPEHRGRRPQQRLDRGVQRALLAAAGVRARAVPGGAGDRVGAGRRRLDRLRRRRDPRAVRVVRRASAQTYHLTAGADASTIAEIADLASGYFQQPPPRLLSPAEFLSADQESRGRCSRKGASYFPYFSVKTMFDDAFTRARLEPAGISCRAAARVPEPSAGLRHLESLGQAPDRPGRGPGRGLGKIRVRARPESGISLASRISLRQFGPVAGRQPGLWQAELPSPPTGGLSRAGALNRSATASILEL